MTTESQTENLQVEISQTKHSSVKPESMPWIIPYLTVKDGNKALEFYERVFKFQKLHAMEEDGIVKHAEMKHHGGVIMFGVEDGFGEDTKSPLTTGIAPPLNLYVYCENVEQFHQQAVAVGAKSLQKPQDMFWGDKMCLLEDVDGFRWCFATYLGEQK